MKKRNQDVNQWWYAVFCLKKGEAESHQLPPFCDCLHHHCKRANYQTAVWKNALTNNQFPGPAGKGWALESDESGQQLDIVWMSGSPAPKAVLELLVCTCKRVCKRNTCECILNGLKFSDLCRLADCSLKPARWNVISIRGRWWWICLLLDIYQSVVLSLHLDRMSSPTYEICGKPCGSLIVKSKSKWHRS